MFTQHSLKAGKFRRLGMRVLDDLRQLAGVANKHDVARGPAHGHHIRKASLSSFFHKQPVKGLHILVASKEPGNGADYLPAASGIVIAGGPVNAAIHGITVILAGVLWTRSSVIGRSSSSSASKQPISTLRIAS